MSSLSILPTTGINLLSFVSQKSPSKLHRITALFIAILAVAVAVAVRHAFCSRTINASEFEPFSDKCASFEDVTDLLKKKQAQDLYFRPSLEPLDPAIQEIHDKSQKLSNNKSLDRFEINIKESTFAGISSNSLQKVISIFSQLNPSLDYKFTYETEPNPQAEFTYPYKPFKFTISRLNDKEMNTRNKLKKYLELTTEELIDFLKNHPTYKNVKTELEFEYISNSEKDLPVLEHHLNLKYPEWDTLATYEGLSVSPIKKDKPELDWEGQSDQGDSDLRPYLPSDPPDL